ncbi:PREDICTED: eukaryotic translation initiation factor 3 subunit B-like [Camelina sativa]|uniref:Eukaryotic translation initiation factor 3 subunit B-like n=1 Tax=Camelina sativa TaxID=90675 RepID=A0ABM0X5I1_CAMSA|nr:PREDICTED: eukaryotic translation initiation factor 3 subunit B-like [Camelina sativa]
MDVESWCRTRVHELDQLVVHQGHSINRILVNDPTRKTVTYLPNIEVVFLQIPGQVELMHKDVLKASNCKMHWQSNGKYLAVQVTRRRCSLFELFRFSEEEGHYYLELDEKILAFAWEPSGHRFAVIHGDQSNPGVSFYSMETFQIPGKVSKLATFEDKQADALFWSPRSKHIYSSG